MTFRDKIAKWSDLRRARKVKRQKALAAMKATKPKSKIWDFLQR
jgi:hypothetical protein